MPHLKIWPLLTATIRYEKTISTRNLGHGEFIDAPILAYLIETSNGRILYDAGCDYRKLAMPPCAQGISTSCAPWWMRPG
jgi:N-acyl homoserine lactone hydrolase